MKKILFQKEIHKFYFCKKIYEFYFTNKILQKKFYKFHFSIILFLYNIKEGMIVNYPI